MGVAQLLVEAGAQIDAKDAHGNTPLSTAVFNCRDGDGALITLLRSRGADPYAANNHGQTPLGLARLIANYHVARWFADLPMQSGESPSQAVLPPPTSSPASHAKGEGRPLMEHPCGDFENAIDAMESAIEKLRSLPAWDQWITITAQGQGHRPDSYCLAEVRLLRDKLDVGPQPLDIVRIARRARVEPSCLLADGECYSVASASPRQLARVLDAIFKHHFRIRPYPDEGDYGVGAEW
jgi:hypothetical protein